MKKSSLYDKGSLYNGTLNDRLLLVSFHNNLKSVDLPDCNFRNFVSFSDVAIINQIRQIKKLLDKTVSINNLPLNLPEEEDNCFLLNSQSTDIGKKVRYTLLQGGIGFTEELTKVLKLEFQKHDSHRVFAFIDTNKNIFKILFLDPFHHVAVGVNSRNKLIFSYENCKDKYIDIASSQI